MDNLNVTFNFNHLSLKDLIEARDLFHVHLINKKNVVATAIGRYLIRIKDLDKNGRFVPKPPSNTVKGERTLANSVVLDISWPCILVFVDQWQGRKELLEKGTNNLIPKSIFMPDGRVVPICIVKATKEEIIRDTIDSGGLRFPNNYIGGGFPLIVQSQGVERMASVGCVVSDGHKYYALTNRHVVGEGGDEIFSKFGDDTVKIGTGSTKSLAKLKFSDVYSGWTSQNMLVNCDIGLVDIEDINQWKTDICVLGDMQEMYDLNIHNLSLGIIAQHEVVEGKKKTSSGKVIAHGATSGVMRGEIVALFYRYKSLGGTEYVSDFLIGGRDGGALPVAHGDSGTVWLMEVPKENQESKKRKKKNKPEEVELHPIAVHWGQHEFLDGTRGRFGYSMATGLSSICRELDVDVVRGWNVNNDFSWGKVGHYTVGALAIDAIKNASLAKFMKANLENISFKEVSKNLDAKGKEIIGLSANPKAKKGFCALADVPDIIWKQKFDKTKSPWGRKGAENPNHYADADAPTIKGGTLYDLCDTEDKLTPDVWMKYYKDVDRAKTGIQPEVITKEGIICFRVWQIYDYMVNALKDKKTSKDEKISRFLFGAGVITHYLGDACQPLHSSYMSDGNPADNRDINYTAKKTSYKRDGTISHNAGDVYAKTVNAGSGVHVAYEDTMIDNSIGKIFPAVKKILGSAGNAINKEVIHTIKSGQGAGFATLQLMQKTQKEIHPVDVVELFKKVKGNGGNVSKELFDEFGTRTENVMARGCRYLATVWEAAWVAGNGAALKATSKVDPDKLVKLYIKPSELPSKNLSTIQTVIDIPKSVPAKNKKPAGKNP